jgi:apolipoprotein N-acyltransferase
MTVNVPRYDGQTIQARWGNWLPRLCVLLVVTFVVVRIAVGPSKRAA